MTSSLVDGDGKASYLEHAPSLRLALGRLSLERKSYKGPDDDDADVQQVEMLLEAYFIHMDNTFNRLDTMNEYISDTEVCDAAGCTPLPYLHLPVAAHAGDGQCVLADTHVCCIQEYIDLEINNFRNNLIRVSARSLCKMGMSHDVPCTCNNRVRMCCCRHA